MLERSLRWHIIDCYESAIHFRKEHEKYIEDPDYNNMYLIIAETYEKLAQDLEKLQGDKK